MIIFASSWAGKRVVYSTQSFKFSALLFRIALIAAWQTVIKNYDKTKMKLVCTVCYVYSWHTRLHTLSLTMCIFCTFKTIFFNISLLPVRKVILVPSTWLWQSIVANAHNLFAIRIHNASPNLYVRWQKVIIRCLTILTCIDLEHAHAQCVSIGVAKMTNSGMCMHSSVMIHYLAHSTSINDSTIILCLCTYCWQLSLSWYTHQLFNDT